jgi:hypothetical protein
MVQVLEGVPGFGSSLGAAIGGGFGKGMSKGMEMAMKMSQEKSEKKDIVDALVKRGMPRDEAELYSKLTKGGQTVFAKDVLEARRRGMDFFGKKTTAPVDKISPAMGDQEEIAQNELSSEKDVESDLKGYVEDQDFGLTPSEKVKRQSERYKSNLPIYQEAGTKIRGLTRDRERLGILEGLDKTNKLPKNLGRINVDKDGNLRFAFASSPEAERYVKTLNEYSAGAKDTFGSRVTNFDLQQYLLRFPNLLNSQEGRKQIYQQMKIVNDINSIYYKNLKKVYDMAGGIRNIDPDVAESMAEKLSEGKIEALQQKFQEIGSFPTLPDPASAKGRKIRNEKTGEVLQSDGTNWLPIGEE